MLALAAAGVIADTCASKVQLGIVEGQEFRDESIETVCNRIACVGHLLGNRLQSLLLSLRGRLRDVWISNASFRQKAWAGWFHPQRPHDGSGICGAVWRRRHNRIRRRVVGASHDGRRCDFARIAKFWSLRQTAMRKIPIITRYVSEGLVESSLAHASG